FSYLHKAPKRNYCDFRVYYATAKRFLDRADIYSRPDPNITPYKYSPFFAFLFSPLGLFSIKQAAIIFFIINFFSLILVFFLSKTLLWKKNEIKASKEFFIYFLSLIFSLRFILQNIFSGQVAILMLLTVLFGLFFLERKNEILAGIFFSFSVMIKYTSFVFILYFLFKKKIKFFVSVLISSIVFMFLPAIWVGWEKNLLFLKNWLPFISKESLDLGSLYTFKNQSIFSFFLRYFTKGHFYSIGLFNLNIFLALFLACFFSFLIYYLIIFFNKKNIFCDKINYALLFICMAIFNPNSWLHNYVFLLFPYILLISYLIKIKFKDKITLVFVLISFILGSWTSESVVGNNLENILEKLSFVSISSFILIFVLFRLKFKDIKGRC
ncbi:MAG: glycosyltransferase family 87 protein, partial [Candidatus Aenigmatarchaeota archaeon]